MMATNIYPEAPVDPTLQRLVAKAWATRSIDADIATNPKPIWGNALSVPFASVVMRFAEDDQKLTLNLAERLIIGRYGPNNATCIDVDLTPYGGLQNGVSRVHATLYRINHLVKIMDMDSANGTYLNGHRLVPYQERILRDGDDVCLGKLRFTVHF